ncbi:DUF4062 domain-containing protein [Pseudofrankia sp. BMG5.36]|uniref:DUF4062 domain-containing protein n=1 Tax=Pseudofrankia sp. BMG5.36 TaxID=1834512 RepID=UPI0009F4561F|nr:DUF4062 domain-containing protein [Pseudofrankia sp. BMG5.36]
MPVPSPRRVFISHTSELSAHPSPVSFVEAVETAVKRAGDAIVDMAYFTSADLSPSILCREMVENSDLYVALVGFRYGSPVRDDPAVSYTELEFNAATDLGIPRLIFLLSEDAEVSRAVSFDLEFGDRQEKFRSRILNDSGLTVQRFNDVRQLETVVLQALMATRTHNTRPSKSRSSRGVGTRTGGKARSADPQVHSQTSKYRQVMRQANRYITPPNTDNASRVALDKIYVVPCLRGRLEISDQDRKIDLDEVLRSARRVVFVGDPGGRQNDAQHKIDV